MHTLEFAGRGGDGGGKKVRDKQRHRERTQRLHFTLLQFRFSQNLSLLVTTNPC